MDKVVGAYYASRRVFFSELSCLENLGFVYERSVIAEAFFIDAVRLCFIVGHKGT